MNQDQKTIKAVVAFNVNRKIYNVLDYLSQQDFTDGVFTGVGSTYIFVRSVEIPIELPENFDIVTPQLKALEDKEKHIDAQYSLAKNEIKQQRNNLLAIEG